MKQIYILGNWKSNKTVSEANAWMDQMKPQLGNAFVILCTPFTTLAVVQYRVKEKQFSFQLGAEDVSPFPDGAYTGEVSARQVKELADWVMIGHSERRKHFAETDEIIAEKVKQSLAAGLRPVVCVSDASQVTALKTHVPDFVKTGIILYEPLAAIGSGQADTPENANATARTLAEILPNVPILYGGSVVPENVKGFLEQEYLSGVGVGGASLDPQKFQNLISAAQ